DTGARTSTLHALNIIPYINKSGKAKIKFQVYPEQRNSNYFLHCKADFLDQRNVKNSGGDVESRYIINTILCMAGYMWPIELTLTNRDAMGFRLLLGRTALSKRFLISPNQSFMT
ncbi:MAG: ATP-dependent zinc protease family protein, partial [Gammaproteobacteria bacterium]